MPFLKISFRKLKNVLIGIISLLFICGLTVFFCDRNIINNAEGKTFDDINKIPTTKAGLLLGTSKYLKSGYINQYFANRITATAELYKAGKIKFVIISGDNGRSTYDEPTDMKNELIEQGVDSTKIYLDYAGFRTFDSMVRVKEIFSQNEVIVISQKFHNERAIYIGEKLGIKAYGFNAMDVNKHYGFKTMVREKFARVKVILDFIIGTKPKFLGEKIELK